MRNARPPFLETRSRDADPFPLDFIGRIIGGQSPDDGFRDE